MWACMSRDCLRTAELLGGKHERQLDVSAVQHTCLPESTRSWTVLISSMLGTDWRRRLLQQVPRCVFCAEPL